MAGRGPAVLGLAWAAAVLVAGGIAVAVEDEALDPYTEAMIEQAAEEGIEESGLDDDQVRCYSAAIVDALGIPDLEAAGVSPQELADADTLVAAGLAPDPAVEAALVDAARRCGLGRALGRSLVTGLDAGLAMGDEPAVSEDGRDCVIASVEADDALLRATVAGYVGTLDDAGFSAQLGNSIGPAVAACPAVIIDVLVAVFDSQVPGGFELATDDRACLTSHFQAQAPAVAEGVRLAFGEDDPDALVGVVTTSMASCPLVFGDLVARIFESEGIELSDAGRDCLDGQIAARAGELPALVLDAAGSEAFGFSIAQACAAVLAP